MNTAQPRDASEQSITAVINYTLDVGKRPQIVNVDHSKNELLLSPHDVPIRDARVAGFNPDLASEGFCRVHHRTAIQNITTSAEAAERYRAELVPLMLELTGADEIIMHPASVVRRQENPGKTLEEAPPVTFAHTDYSFKGAVQAEAFFPSRPDARRKAMFNMWKLLSPGPTNVPLALCDSTSVLPEDIIPGDSHFPDDFSFETAFVRYNSDHRWYYYPDLTAEQLLVFKQGDTDANYPRLVPHTAFDDPRHPHAAGRISMESRCMAVWFS